MIRIEITDPHLLDKEVLAKTGVYLMQLAGSYIVPAPVQKTESSKTVMPSAPPIAPTLEREQDIIVEELIVTDSIPTQETPISAPVEYNPFANSGIDLDSKGLPWDARIHSRTKSRNADGSWKVQRNADPVIVLKVTNELRQTMQAPAAPQPMEIPVPVPTPEPDLFPIPETVDFEKLMRSITDSIKAGKLKHVDVVAACGTVGLPTPAALANRPDLVPGVYKALEQFFG